MGTWNGWYHVSGCTYGTWLPGDPRGWRAEDHKVHVEGDYKKPPPPGVYRGLHKYSRNALRFPPVRLTSAEMQLAGRAMVEMLLHQRAEVIAACVGSVHFHLLARFDDADVRRRVGVAKKHAYYAIRSGRASGPVWGSGTKATPIKGRSHQLRVFEYLCRHRQQGAWLWTFRDGIGWPSTIRKK